MATEHTIRLWSSVLDDVLIPYNAGTNALRMYVDAAQPLPRAQAAGIVYGMCVQPIITAADADPPVPGTDVDEILQPVFKYARRVRQSDLGIEQYAILMKKMQTARDRLDELA